MTQPEHVPFYNPNRLREFSRKRLVRVIGGLCVIGGLLGGALIRNSNDDPPSPGACGAVEATSGHQELAGMLQGRTARTALSILDNLERPAAGAQSDKAGLYVTNTSAVTGPDDIPNTVDDQSYRGIPEIIVGYEPEDDVMRIQAALVGTAHRAGEAGQVRSIDMLLRVPKDNYLQMATKPLVVGDFRNAFRDQEPPAILAVKVVDDVAAGKGTRHGAMVTANNCVVTDPRGFSYQEAVNGLPLAWNALTPADPDALADEVAALMVRVDEVTDVFNRAFGRGAA